MSFILDALKKSETDRQRQTGPALFEVKVASPRPRFPLWAAALAALLGVNLIILGWLGIRRMTHSEPSSRTAQPAPATAGPANLSQPYPAQPPAQSPGQPYAQSPGQPYAQPPGQPYAQSPGQPYAQPPGQPYAQSPGQPYAPPPGQPYAQPPGQPYAQSQALGPGQAPQQAPSQWNTASPNRGTEPPGPTLSSEPNAQAGNPDDYAPATEPTSTSPFKGHVRRGTESGVPLYQDAAVAPGANLPSLRLDLHVFAAKPEDRFVLINMHKLHEGDSLPDGVRVERITPDGAVLSRNGSEFMLPRE
ncbi:MAG TPA: general secretion pathway protein GspB [Steroidobacteraceae bacterium]|nr:general secretion pathway protein GspB [Steroidobacteraceae bacterium]